MSAVRSVAIQFRGSPDVLPGHQDRALRVVDHVVSDAACQQSRGLPLRPAPPVRAGLRSPGVEFPDVQDQDFRPVAGSKLGLCLLGPAGRRRAVHREQDSLEHAASSDASLGMDTYECDPSCDLAVTTGGYRQIGRRVADLELPTIVVQEGGYYAPHLGENVREWLQGFLRHPPTHIPNHSNKSGQFAAAH